MQMLTKFESKSNRVKGIAFHPRLTLLAASLHSGTIQLWNFQMGVLVDRFEEHDGPVRGISFHSTQPLFCSGGDDYKIKVWNYKTRRCLFTLHGHLDYVRSVYFHHEHPWILSASDDQTIRIWNWQSRQCIAILTGHNHYIMCAQFHPKEDYVVSASMDQTVRVWDISGLRKKNTTAQPLSFEEQIQRANSGQADLFGNTDAVVKYVLEGHDRGVNWATFHPTLPLIVSCGDDRQIKLWRMSETKAWEVDTCRGHFNNVSVALFHPKHELIISDSEDKTIRVWDMSKRTAVQTFRRENDRFWVLTAHPELNLFAAGHDSGLIVFKLDRERPAFSIHGNTLFYVRDKYVRAHDLTTGSDTGVISVRRLGSQYVQPRTLSYNPAERAVIVTSPADNGLYELVHLPKDMGSGEVRDSASEGKRGTGASALFVARNRFAVLDKTAQTIEIRDLDNTITKSIKCPVVTTDIFYGGTASVLLSTPNSVVLFDIQQQKVIAELATPLVKYAVWSNDNSMVALLSKHTIMIANKNLGQSAMVHETIRIKSGAWDDSGIFIYSTLNHIKYALPQGDNGIIKTLDQPVYLTRIKGKVVHCLDRNAKPRAIPIDPTEYRFKLALMRKNYDEVLHIIRTSNLVGQSIIAYLQKKGFPEIALHFVQDKTTRFDLAIECGNLEVALEMAKAIDRDENWSRLGQQALKQGNHKIVEICYQRTKNFDRLSFLYLVTGNPDKLGKMAKIAEMRGDQMSRFHNALYLGNVEARIAVLREVGLYPLAYMTAKSNALEDIAEDILAEAGLNEEDVTGLLPQVEPSSLRPPPVVTATFEHNWPNVGVTESFFDRALAAAASGEPSSMDFLEGGEAGDRGLDDWAGEDGLAPDGLAAEEAEDAWDLAPDAEAEVEIEEEADEAVDEDVGGAIVPGIPETELWVRNSPLAADHVAAGSFETAMTLLNKQVAVVDFAPLKPLFLSVYQSSRMYLPGAPSLPPLEVPLRRNTDHAEPRSVLPVASLTLASITSGELRAAYAAFQKAKFADAATIFRSILHSLLLVVTSTPAQAAELQELVVVCREYLIGLSLEMERRRIQEQPESQKRQLELAAYFTHCRLQPAHLSLALRLAMTTFTKAKNYPTAATFAQKLLDLNPAPPVATQARTVLATANKNPRDAIEIEYDLHSQFDICPASLTPIYQGSPSVVDSFTGASYHPQFKDTLCRVSQVTQVGVHASGLRSSLSLESGSRSSFRMLPANHRERPYLGRKARVILAPVSLAYLSLFALGLSLVLLLQSLDAQVADVKSGLNQTCAGVESTASFAASIPHYSANVTNRATVAAINGTLGLTSTMLNLALDLGEGLIKFAITMINTPVVCLCEFDEAALSILVDAASLINGAIDAAAKGLVDGVNAVLKVANGAINTLDKVPGVHVAKIDVDLGVLTQGVNIIPDDFLLKLNNTVPTLGDAEKMLYSLVTIPLEVLRTTGTQSLADVRRQLRTDLFPIPDTKELTFCSGLNTSFVDDVGAEVKKWATWGLEALVIGGICLGVALALLEWVELKALYTLITHLRKIWVPDNDPASAKPSTARLLGFLQAVDHPFLTLALSRFGAGTIWFVTYITYPPALLYLFIGLVGVALINLQLYFLTGPVREAAAASIGQGLDDLVDDITTKLNNSLIATSQDFANTSNTQIDKIEAFINENALGWVTVSVDAVNTTMEGFTSNLQTSVQNFFGTGEWGSLVTDLISCIIGAETSELQAMLAWVKSHGQVSLPQVSSTQFVLSNDQMGDVTSGLGGSSGQSPVESFISTFIERYESVLRSQLWVFYAYIGVWVVVVVFGLIGVTFTEAVVEWRQIKWRQVKANFKGLRNRITGGGGIREKSDRYVDEKPSKSRSKQKKSRKVKNGPGIKERISSAFANLQSKFSRSR